MNQMEQNGRNEILAIDNLSRKFGDTVALERVHFDLREGEVHCLVGENGAGKSTLIKILSGAERPDEGLITAFGTQYNRLTPQQSFGAGIATIYQDIELVSSLTVADNIFIGRELRTKWGFIDSPVQNRKAGELMKSMNIDLPPTALVESLSPAQQQTLQIVKALYLNAKILILDEPTASLGVAETKALLETIRNLTAQGRGIVYISHFLREIFEIGDRVTVLKDGRVTGTFKVGETSLAAITMSMIGRERSLFYDREAVETGEVTMQVRDLGRHEHFERVTFDLHRGEILGFGGVVGSGRSALMRVLFGAERRTSGHIRLNDRVFSPATPTEAIALGVAMIPEDRKTLGLFDLRSLLENIVIVQNELTMPVLNHTHENRSVKELITRLHIVAAGPNQQIGSLSGGNQQRAMLARWMLSNASVYIFDEPTRGVDIGAKEEIYKCMVELAKAGKSLLMVSSDMPELISMSDRVAVMRNGELITIVDAKSVTEQQLLGYFLGIA